MAPTPWPALGAERDAARRHDALSAGTTPAERVHPEVVEAKWDLPDPQGRPLAEVRRVRDDIAARVAALVRELDDPDQERAASSAEP